MDPLADGLGLPGAFWGTAAAILVLLLRLGASSPAPRPRSPPPPRQAARQADRGEAAPRAR